MKKLSFLLLALSLFTSTFAASVDVNYALRVAQNFYQQTSGNLTTLTLTYQRLNTDESNGVAIGEPLYYVFSAAGNKGYVMVSADDVAKPILGYGTTGQFVIQNAPAVITDWFDKYANEIAYVKANHVSAPRTTSDQWNNYYNNILPIESRSSTAVGPLLTTGWNQDVFYNDMCPQDASAPSGYGGRCPTGCGATAMAQIMRYWSYPAQGTGSNSYVSNYGTLSANFGTTTYTWTNMPAYVSSANTDVATLMYDCGVAVDMVYGAAGSSSYMIGSASNCETAYTTYFGYDPATIQGLLKSNYPVEANWINLIQAELNANRPIQYAGSDPSAGGHTFVLDGSDVNGNFHINWGWGGQDNNFYGIDALDPTIQQETFNQNEAMITGIQPLNHTTSTANIQLDTVTTVTPYDTVGFGQVFSVYANVINRGAAGFTGEYCALLFDSIGNFMRVIGNVYGTGGTALPAGSHYLTGFTFTDTSTSLTLPGTYFVGIYFQPTGASTWTLAGANTYTNPVSMVVLAPWDSIELYSDISISPSPAFIQGQAATVTVNLANYGTATYYGQYEAVLLDISGTIIEQTIGTYTESAGLPAGSAYTTPPTFSTNAITVGQGEYILAIGEQRLGTTGLYYCGGQLFMNPIRVNVAPSTLTTAINEIPSHTLKVYPNPTHLLLNIEAGDVQGNYTLEIFNVVGQKLRETNGTLDGQKISTDVSSFTPGLYTIQLKTESGKLNTQFVVN